MLTWLQKVGSRLCLAAEHAWLRVEHDRMIRELRREHGGGPIPMTKQQIHELRAVQASISPERRKELGYLDLDHDVVEVEE